MKSLIVWAGLCVGATAAVAQVADVESIPPTYIEAYRNGDAAGIAALFAPDATLVPLLPMPRMKGREAVQAYYQRGMSSSKSRSITPSNEVVQAYGDVIVRSADVRIEQELNDGRKLSFPARVTFVYRKEPAGWLIVHHHQSVQPAPPPSAASAASR